MASALFAELVALVGGAVVRIRHRGQGRLAQAFGQKPAIPPARPQGAIPTLKMPTARGWVFRTAW